MKAARLTAIALAVISASVLHAQDNTAAPSGRSAPLQLKERPEQPAPAVEFNAQNPPQVMHLCLAHCFPIRWENGRYINADPRRTSIYTIESFTRESLVLHRTDTGAFPLTAVLQGQISADGERIEDGRVVWTSGNHGEGKFRAAWGSALESVPGSDEEAQRLAKTSSSASASAGLSTPKSRQPLLPSMSEPTSAMRSLRVNLTGDWEGYYTSPMFATTIRIKQSGATITAEFLTSSLSPTGHPFFRGTYDPPAIAGQVELAQYAGLLAVTGTPSSWIPATITVGDPDHFRIADKPPFQRIITLSNSGDVPCEASNPLHVQAEYAMQRGRITHTLKDYKSSVCWFYVGAVAGNAEAQGLLGAYFREGFHVEKNLRLAFYWTEKSAEAGNPSGALTLATLYEQGIGTSADSAKAQFWRARSKLLEAQENKEALAEQHADAVQNQRLEALTRVAVAGAKILADPGDPAPCRVLAHHGVTASDALAADAARREIEAKHIKCSSDDF